MREVEDCSGDDFGSIKRGRAEEAQRGGAGRFSYPRDESLFWGSVSLAHGPVKNAHFRCLRPVACIKTPTNRLPAMVSILLTRQAYAL